MSSPPIRKRKKFGELLVAAGLIDRQTLTKALQRQKGTRKHLGQILLEMNCVDDRQIARTLADQFAIPLVAPETMAIAPEVIGLVPRELAWAKVLLPVKKDASGLTVAFADPVDNTAVDDLQFVTQMPIKMAVAPHQALREAIEKYYSGPGLTQELAVDPNVEKNLEVVQRFGPEADDDIEDVRELLNLTQRPPVVRFTNSILADAIKLKASDIHIEPRKTKVIIRYRIDGLMREIMRADRHIHASLVSRIKVIANMDITLRRKPQDGKTQVKLHGQSYDLRVSTLPTAYGEKATIRILNPDAAGMGIEHLGFSPADLERLQNAIAKPQGILLVTGPTGSGKSSTLYACLNRLNAPEVNIITVEDPIEFEVEGINQVQINPKAGITFAAGLRSILRQDPDIVMVGEIRDAETAAIAFQAAQTGHLVLSTLHTNSAPAAVTRLLDLEIEPFMVASALVGVVGQRLVRKVCEACKAPQTLPPELSKRLPSEIADDPQHRFWMGMGCSACNQTGYRGRVGLFEVMGATQRLRGIINPGVSESAVRQTAQGDGYRTLSLDGIEKALQGLTTIEEVLRVAPPDPSEWVATTTLAPGDTQQIPDAGQRHEDLLLADQPPAATSRPAEPLILVVDDNAFMVKVLTGVLQKQGYRVLPAANGIEALKAVDYERPDLVVTDQMMPQMDGITLIKKLRSRPQTRGIPIIIVTAKDELDTEVAGIDAGADDYLTKPLNAKRLLVRIKRLLRRAA